MNKRDAVKLAKRINTEDQALKAEPVPIGKDNPDYLVAIAFIDSEQVTLIRHEGEWEFLKALRDMDDEERESIRVMKRQDKRERLQRKA